MSIKLDRRPPERLVRVLVRPGDKTAQLKGVDLADVERGFAVRTESKLVRARLNEVLLLGGPHKRILLETIHPVFSRGERKA